MTNKIDLSQLVGQKVVCKFVGHRDLIGPVENSGGKDFSYSILGYYFNANGEGWSHEKIKSISTYKEIPLLTGITQKHPNINLEDFRNQKVFIKWSTLHTSINTVYYDEENQYWCADFNTNLRKDGTHEIYANYIQEIYGPGAYHIVTKEITDEPTDPAVEKAREAVQGLTEEQIAKLLHTLKK
jgi:hypothetical protein